MYYAEIKKDGRCFHVTPNELPESETIIKTETNDVLGKYWDGENWIEPQTAEE